MNDEKPKRRDMRANAQHRGRSRAKGAQEYRKKIRERRKSKPAPVAGSARLSAYHILDEFSLTGRFVSDLIDDHIRTERLKPEDRKLVHELCGGVLRHRRLLEAVWKSALRNPDSPPEPGLALLLSLGVYQMLFMNIPDHAAVHETVQLTDPLRKPAWTGFANGILRTLGREKPAEMIPLPSLEERTEAEIESDPFKGWGPRFIPLRDGMGCVWPKPVLPDARKTKASWFSVAFSLPMWIARRWSERFDAQQLIELGQSLGVPGPLTLRVNLRKGSRKSLLDWFSEWEATVAPGDLPESIRTEGLTVADLITGLDAGLFSIQDESAMRAVRLLDPQPGQKVLDLCAGPGTKTAQMAEWMDDSGSILACDVSRVRVHRIQENINRLGLSIIEPLQIGKDGSDLPDDLFDCVLVDVPCSNSGVLGKRPEARWRMQQEDLEELPTIQREILDRGISRLKSGGRICYSTCSIEPEENEQVVRSAMESHPDLELIEEKLHLPVGGHDGAYAAVLSRREA